MSDRRRPLVGRFARYGSVCEVGIGRRPGVARALAERGVDVRCVDRVERPVPDSVRFVEDDVVAASRRKDLGEVYHVEAIYALAAPHELHRPIARVARRVGSEAFLTTIGDERPVVPVDSESLGGGIVAHRVRVDDVELD